MRRSRRARTARRPLPHSTMPRRAMPPTPAPVRARALGREMVSPSTSVPGAVVAVVASTAAGLAEPAALTVAGMAAAVVVVVVVVEDDAATKEAAAGTEPAARATLDVAAAAL